MLTKRKQYHKHRQNEVPQNEVPINIFSLVLPMADSLALPDFHPMHLGFFIACILFLCKKMSYNNLSVLCVTVVGGL